MNTAIIGLGNSGSALLPDCAQLVKAFATLGAESPASGANCSPNAQCCSTQWTNGRAAEW